MLSLSRAIRVPVRWIGFKKEESSQLVRIVSIRQHLLSSFHSLRMRKVHVVFVLCDLSSGEMDQLYTRRRVDSCESSTFY